MSTDTSTSAFLNLSYSIREQVYAYLLLPHPEEEVTTINYTLNWPHLDDPSNTTFAGITKIDPCTCPRKDTLHQRERRRSHIYTRYKCSGPDIHFSSASQGLWVLQAAYGQLNILRPASDDELEQRPKVAILQVSEHVHDEALPFVYRGRNFLFLSGPCPRGRYQAYATLRWLQLLSKQAQKSVEALSLLVQPYEEDCSATDVERSYMDLAMYIRDHVSSFRRLYLNVWDEETYRATSVFACILEREGVNIVVRKQSQDVCEEIFDCKQRFLECFEEAEQQSER